MPNTDLHQKYGYVRVSAKSQEFNASLKNQKETLINQGVPSGNIRVEIGSATDDPISTRPIFLRLIEEELQENDLLFVTKIDRCSRNTLEFLQLQKKLFDRSIRFQSLDLPCSDDMAVNNLISTTLAAIATFETERRLERQKIGIAAAKKAGKYTGRKTVINQKLIQEVKELKEVKKLSVTQIAKITGRARATIYKILKNELGYVSNKLVPSQENQQNEETNTSK